MSALDNWREELRSVYLYDIAARTERGTPQGRMFAQLSSAAARQAAIWAAELARAGEALPERYTPDLRTRLVGTLLARLGVRPLRGVLAAMKVRGMAAYRQAGHAMPQSLAEVGRRHRATRAGGNLRAAVFGVNDGLLSNTTLMMGMAGASSDPHVVVLAGVAGLLAGAVSMAAGEYVSVRSQRDMYEYQIGLERTELAQYPAEEAAELALIYEAEGLAPDDARRLAATLIADPDQAMDALTRFELGLNPQELGSPWGAAGSSFLSFALGAAVPLLPFAFGTGERPLVAAMALTAASLFGIGATVSLFTGRNAWRGGLRMLAIGAGAAAATYLLGKAVAA